MSVRSEPLSRTKSGKLSENASLPDEGEKGLQTRSGRTVKLSEKARGADCEKLMGHGKHSKSVGAHVGQTDRSPPPAASDVRSTARPVVYEDDVVVNMPGPTQLTVIHKGPSSKAGSRASKAGSTSKTGSRTSSRDSARRELKQAELRLRQEEERAKIEMEEFHFRMEQERKLLSLRGEVERLNLEVEHQDSDSDGSSSSNCADNDEIVSLSGRSSGGRRDRDHEIDHVDDRTDRWVRSQSNIQLEDIKE